MRSDGGGSTAFRHRRSACGCATRSDQFAGLLLRCFTPIMFRQSIASRTRGDNLKSAIGDAVLTLIRLGEAGPWGALQARLERDGSDAAARRVRTAVEEAEGKEPMPRAVVTKKRRG